MLSGIPYVHQHARSGTALHSPPSIPEIGLEQLSISTKWNKPTPPRLCRICKRTFYCILKNFTMPYTDYIDRINGLVPLSDKIKKPPQAKAPPREIDVSL